MTDGPRNIRREVLPNGLTVITEEMQHVRSISMGIWVKTGSRDEDGQHNGISHFIEHMLFKGTKHRSAEDIARQVDSIGGNMDAFTAKECICFNAKVLDEHLPKAMEVLSDLVLNPLFEATDITRERGVIMEEIKMDEDNPDYLVHEIFTQSFWKDHPLGKPILGTKETVKRFEKPVVSEFYGQRFYPGNMIIAAAGNLKHEQVLEMVRERFEGMKPGSNGHGGAPPKIPAYPIAHEKRFVCYVLNTVLGGGMSSRLFQNIREKQGLAYSIYSDLNPYRDTGVLSVYAGTSRESAVKVVESVVAEFRKLKTEMVPADELRRAKDQLKGSLVLSLESSMSCMSNLARQEMYFDRFYGIDDLIGLIEKVTSEELLTQAQEFFQGESIAVTVLGNLNGLKLTRNQLAC
jgi:predicted Zn-dependent peptidase